MFPNVPINNNLALVQIMAWRRTGEKQYEPIMYERTNVYMRQHA